MLNVDEDTSFIYLSGEINISTNGVVVGDIEPVLGCVGYNVRLRDIAGEICEYVIDLLRVFGSIMTESVEGSANGCGSVDHGSAIELISCERLDLGSSGICVHVARDDDGKLLLREISYNVERAELACFRALVVEVGVEEGK